MENEKNMPERTYFKNVSTINFIVGRIIVIAVYIFFIDCILFFGGFLITILKRGDIYAQWALIQEYHFIYFGVPSFVVFIYFVYQGIKQYGLMKKSPFASMGAENLTLDYGKTPLLWDQMQTVTLKENRKFVITYVDGTGKSRKRRIGLMWFQEKDDFISHVKRKCVEHNILYSEGVDKTQ